MIGPWSMANLYTNLKIMKIGAILFELISWRQTDRQTDRDKTGEINCRGKYVLMNIETRIENREKVVD